MYTDKLWLWKTVDQKASPRSLGNCGGGFIQPVINHWWNSSFIVAYQRQIFHLSDNNLQEGWYCRSTENQQYLVKITCGIIIINIYCNMQHVKVKLLEGQSGLSTTAWRSFSACVFVLKACYAYIGYCFSLLYYIYSNEVMYIFVTI